MSDRSRPCAWGLWSFMAILRAARAAFARGCRSRGSPDSSTVKEPRTIREVYENRDGGVEVWPVDGDRPQPVVETTKIWLKERSCPTCGSGRITVRRKASQRPSGEWTQASGRGGLAVG
jgi:hypothetical protein